MKSSGHTEDDAAKIEAVKAGIADATAGKPHLQAFCTDHCCLRYLRARNMHEAQAISMLKETLKWREENQMHKVSWHDVKAQGNTGKIMRLPMYDCDGRPVLLMRPRHEKTPGAGQANVRHVAYHMEMTSRLADRVSPDGKVLVIIDFTKMSVRNQPPINISIQVQHLLANHFPERLHESVLWHPPTIFNVVWKAVQPFMDAKTKKRVTFVMAKDKDAAHFLPKRLGNISRLDTTLGGNKEDCFDLQSYEEQMLAEEEEHAAELDKHVQSNDAGKVATG